MPSAKRTRRSKPAAKEGGPDLLRMLLVPCSCGTSFAVAENYDRRGTNWSRYLICPDCGKRHDPKNRLLELGYQPAGYWHVNKC